MHIPDGMLSTPVAVVADVGAVAALTYSVRWIRTKLSDKKLVLMAVLGALIFALQMLNFPVAGGTSGHFGGGTLAAITCGFWPASVVMSAVLGIQALVFSDGGILAFGANVLNMGIIAPAVGWLIWRAATRIGGQSKTARIIGAGIAAWAGTVVSAAAVAFEIWISGHANFALVFGAMVGWHALIGIGEGVITAALVGYLLAVRPDLLDDGVLADRIKGSLRSVLVTLGIVAVAAAGVSWLASSSPDGLEFVYFDSGIGKAFRELSLIGDGTVFADYGVRGFGNEALGTVLAGIVGLVLVAALLWVLFAPKTRKQPARGN
ncbi:MAG: energy-coupling factor ABC transporter permease [Actinomycetes bacterium]|jgi:cobalt/nickel transport system permease protein|nr:energy-coupling factor ABC transporter permease [Actinomycetes bacterium]